MTKDSRIRKDTSSLRRKLKENLHEYHHHQIQRDENMKLLNDISWVDIDIVESIIEKINFHDNMMRVLRYKIDLVTERLYRLTAMRNNLVLLTK